MKITLDQSACVGHGRCYALAPEVFGPDEMGHCELLQAEPAESLQAVARTAVASCPEEALHIED